MERLERFQGCLLGLAVGDALGTTLEFKKPGSFEPLTDMIGGGPFGLAPGQWTDDTSMALCLAESLVEKQGFDARDQMERYVRWYRTGYISSTGRCFDIGGTTRHALVRFERTGNPFSGPTDRVTAGNGSIMRLAPVPMFYAREPENAIRFAAESSRTTHGSILAVDACRYMAGIIVGALNGEPKKTLLAPNYCPIPGYWDDRPLCPEIAQIAAGSFKHRNPPDIKGAGYVVQSLEAALWAFHHSITFKDGCLLAVNLGDDADTTGAVYGQIAGAFYGMSGIPAEWLAVLSHNDMIRNLADRIIAQAFAGGSR